MRAVQGQNCVRVTQSADIISLHIVSELKRRVRVFWRVCNFDKSGVFVRQQAARRGEDPCNLLVGGGKRGRESCAKFGESVVQTDR